MRREAEHRGHRRWTRRAVLAAALVGAALAWAADGPRVPKPRITIEKSGRCVADTELMRREHMNFLKHQRDRTVRDGVRTPRYSLTGCIECHAGSRDGTVAGSNDDFCQGCHAYVAVKLDCFECHSARRANVAAVRPTAGRAP